MASNFSVDGDEVTFVRDFTNENKIKDLEE